MATARRPPDRVYVISAQYQRRNCSKSQNTELHQYLYSRSGALPCELKEGRMNLSLLSVSCL
jgi:hypothetical protein